MKCRIPEISWHNREPVLSIDIQKMKKDGTFYRLASCGTDTHVIIWYMSIQENGMTEIEFASDLQRHQSAVNVVRFSPCGEFLASGDDDSIIIIWKQKSEQDLPEFPTEDAESNKEQWITFQTLRGHVEDVYDLSWSPDSTRLISGSVDNSAILWKVNKGKKIGILSDHKSFVQGVAWDPKNKYAATLGGDRTCRIYSLKTCKAMYRVSKTTLPVPEGSELDGKVVRLFYDDTYKSYFRRLSFSPDGELLIAPSGVIESPECKKLCNVTHVFTRRSLNKPVLYLPSPEQFTIAVRCCPILFTLREGESVFALPYRIVFAVATQTSVVLYDTQQAEPFGIISNITYTRLTDLSWSSDARILVISSTDGYCSIVTFSPGELGDEYQPKTLDDSEGQTSKLSDTAKSNSVKISSPKQKAKPASNQQECKQLEAVTAEQTVKNTESTCKESEEVKQEISNSESSTSDFIDKLPVADASESSAVFTKSSNLKNVSSVTANSEKDTNMEVTLCDDSNLKSSSGNDLVLSVSSKDIDVKETTDDSGNNSGRKNSSCDGSDKSYVEQGSELEVSSKNSNSECNTKVSFNDNSHNQENSKEDFNMEVDTPEDSHANSNSKCDSGEVINTSQHSSEKINSEESCSDSSVPVEASNSENKSSVEVMPCSDSGTQSGAIQDSLAKQNRAGSKGMCSLSNTLDKTKLSENVTKVASHEDSDVLSSKDNKSTVEIYNSDTIPSEKNNAKENFTASETHEEAKNSGSDEVSSSDSLNRHRTTKEKLASDNKFNTVNSGDSNETCGPSKTSHEADNSKDSTKANESEEDNSKEPCGKTATLENDSVENYNMEVDNVEDSNVQTNLEKDSVAAVNTSETISSEMMITEETKDLDMEVTYCADSDPERRSPDKVSDMPNVVRDRNKDSEVAQDEKSVKISCSNIESLMEVCTSEVDSSKLFSENAKHNLDSEYPLAEAESSVQE